MPYEAISTELKDRVLTLTLNRPDRMNAFTVSMGEEFKAAIEEASENDEVRAIVVTGAGRAFCAGMDLGDGENTFKRGVTMDEHRDEGGQLALALFDCKKPLIAAINGAAVGVGATMTLPMDVRLASSDARFGFVFTRRGITPEACSTWFLPRIVGMSQAQEWVLSGRVFKADEALAGRLVSKVLAPDELLPAARALAQEIADNTSAVSVALARQMLWKMQSARHPMEAHLVESKAIYYMGKSADAAEGIGSFLEKRPAKFSMSAAREMPPFYPWWRG